MLAAKLGYSKLGKRRQFLQDMVIFRNLQLFLFTTDFQTFYSITVFENH